MIPISRLLYKIDLKLNKVGSGQNQRISAPNKVFTLNEAQLRVFKKKVGLNNLYKLGFDAFTARYEELQNFVVPYENLTPIKTGEIWTSYSVDFSNLSNKVFIPIDIVCKGKRGDCVERTINVSMIVRHADLQNIMHNSHFGPSFLFQETIAVISGDKVIIYTNDPDGDFELTDVKISYLRYPKEVDVEGYKHLDGTPSTTIDCELEESLEDELLELAILELGVNTGNVGAAQGALQKSQNSEL